MTSALASEPFARGIPCSRSRPPSPGVKTIKTFGAPGPSRITVIWWRFLTCLAASLVVVRLPAGISALVRHGRARPGALPGEFQPKGDPR